MRFMLLMLFIANFFSTKCDEFIENASYRIIYNYDGFPAAKFFTFDGKLIIEEILELDQDPSCFSNVDSNAPKPQPSFYTLTKTNNNNIFELKFYDKSGNIFFVCIYNGPLPAIIANICNQEYTMTIEKNVYVHIKLEDKLDLSRVTFVMGQINAKSNPKKEKSCTIL